MTCTLRIRLTMARGAVLRVLRLIEHRCDRVLSLSAQTAQGGALTLELTVAAKVPPHSLARQLEKLYDVDHVAIVAPEAGESAVLSDFAPDRT